MPFMTLANVSARDLAEVPPARGACRLALAPVVQVQVQCRERAEEAVALRAGDGTSRPCPGERPVLRLGLDDRQRVTRSR